MIDIKHLADNTARYAHELEIRGKNPALALEAKELYQRFKEMSQTLDDSRRLKNDFNDKIVNLSGQEKQDAIESMKSVSENIKVQESELREVKEKLDDVVSKIPNLTWDNIPVGLSDENNPVVQTWGTKPEFSFTPKPYYELEVYKKYVDQESGSRAMGSRGYYMRGEIARFRKVLFDWAEEKILENGFEYFYVPLMLNEKAMTEIGNLPDFDGQLYEVPISEDTNYYLIPSSEQPLMAYFAGQNLGNLEKPVLVMANTSCFRKESGSYGKDQQGILRVHQFEKIEIDALCKPEDNDKVFNIMGKLEEDIYNELGIHFRAVEVCSGDMPAKHYRQVDYEAWFPGENKFREICSNGSAGDYQNRGLKITYNKNGNREFPWGLNCTGITFRTGLAILEQFQQADGSVKLPEIIAKRFGKAYLS